MFVILKLFFNMKHDDRDVTDWR